MISLLVIGAVLAQFTTSQSSIIMIMLSFMMGICDESEEVKLSRILLPLTFVFTSFMGMLPIGSTGVTMYLMLNQFIEATGETRILDLFSLMKCAFIPGLIGIIYCTFTYKWLPKKDVDMTAFAVGTKNEKEETITPFAQNVIYIGFIFCIVGLFLTKILGERAYFIPLAVCMIMIFLKVMPGQYFLNSIMHGPVLMCATIMGIANILTASGAGNMIGQLILKVLGGNPSGVAIVVAFAFVTLFTSSFISNMATFMVLIPIACNVCSVAGYDPRAAVVAIYVCSLLTVMTPMANAGSAICYSACNLSVKETFKWAFPGSVLCTVLVIINCILVYPV